MNEGHIPYWVQVADLLHRFVNTVENILRIHGRIGSPGIQIFAKGIFSEQSTDPFTSFAKSGTAALRDRQDLLAACDRSDLLSNFCLTGDSLSCVLKDLGDLAHMRLSYFFKTVETHAT